MNRHDLVYPEQFPGGLKGFIKKVLDEYAEQFLESSDDEPAPRSSRGVCTLQKFVHCIAVPMYFASGASRNEAGGASKLEEAIISALGKNTEKWERIDFEKRMHELKPRTSVGAHAQTLAAGAHAPGASGTV